MTLPLSFEISLIVRSQVFHFVFSDDTDIYITSWSQIIKYTSSYCISYKFFCLLFLLNIYMGKKICISKSLHWYNCNKRCPSSIYALHYAVVYQVFQFTSIHPFYHFTMELLMGKSTKPSFRHRTPPKSLTNIKYCLAI